MWYFLPTHHLILNFYYFVNYFTFIFICYYYITLYYIFIFLFIFYLFIYFIFFLLSSLFSIFLFFSSTYSLIYPSSFPHHRDMPPSYFFHYFPFFILFLFFLPTLISFHLALHFLPFFRTWQLDDLTQTSILPISRFLLPDHPPTPIPSRAPPFPHFIFFLPHSTHGQPALISFPFYFLLQLVPTPTSPPDSIIIVGGMTSAPFSAPLHPHFLHFSSSHFFFIYLLLYLFIIFISFLFPKNPSTLTVGRSPTNRCRRPPPIFSHSLTFPSHSFSIIIIIIIKYEIWANFLLVN